VEVVEEAEAAGNFYLQIFYPLRYSLDTT